jgi:hypothetical protein
MRLQRPGARAAGWLVGASVLLGLAVSCFMTQRSHPSSGDQLNLLARGWLLAARGHWVTFGNPMSGGGHEPGGLTSLLVGLPLMLWRDHRAPTLVVVLSQLVAYLLLDRTLRRVLAPHERVLLAVLYWWNPWRIYFSALLWNPDYLFLLGAVHLWTCLGQRHRPRFWLSLWHGAILVLAFQIHASFLLLVIPSALLWWRGYFQPHWLGGALGIALGSLPLVPWLLDLVGNPSLATAVASEGFLGRGLLYVFPLVRGLLYVLRYGSLHLADTLTRFDFSSLLGSDPWLGPGLTFVCRFVLPLTVVLPLLAHLRLWRRQGRRWQPPRAPTTDRAWLRGYVRWSLAGAVVVFALAPTTIMYWQVLALFHVAVLPLVFWAGALWRSRHRATASRAIVAWSLATAVLVVAIALASPPFRCGGRGDKRYPQAHVSPMFSELGIQTSCPWQLGQPGGWWADVLPAEDEDGPR